MSPIFLVKALLSILGAAVLGAGALFGLRRRDIPPRAQTQPGTELPAPGPGKAAPTGVLAILGTSGIVAIVALLGTLTSVVIGNFNLREQLAADRTVRATEQAGERNLQEDQQAEERSKREDERVDELYGLAVDQMSSGTPELQVVGVYELGGVIRAAAQSARYDHTARDILAGNLRVFAPRGIVSKLRRQRSWRRLTQYNVMPFTGRGRADDQLG